MFDPELKFVTSYCLSPTLLGFIRLLFGLYSFITALFVLVWGAVKLDEGNSYFSYFTHLSYIGLCAYFWASGVQSLLYAKNTKNGRVGGGYPLQNWHKVLQRLHVLLFSSIVTFPFLVTIVYWALLSSADTFETPYSAWSNISQHAFNSLFVLFEVFVTNTAPMPWIDLLFTVIMLGGYLGVAYITRATQGIYTYSFLDPKKQGKLLAAYIVGIAVGQCIVFVIVRYVIIFRQKLLRRPAHTDSEGFVDEDSQKKFDA